ncbi:MAG: TonB-dependent receptor [Bacteroidales bacterium]|jgi:hypothetical protein|nr:TonB-dependent receptor [Bacteroidales bacterium]
MKKIIFVVILLLTFLTSNMAQNSTVRGFVYSSVNGEPISYATVQLQGTQYGALSDKNGSFMINNIPNGQYVLQVTGFGYDLFTDTISIEKTIILVKRYHLQQASYSLEEVQISAEGYRNIQETRTSVISVTPKEMSKMPSIGGQPDFAQYLQVLPGVVSTGDQGGQLYIRGGSPVQNMMLLDGAVIFNPFHSIGLFSVFDADIMSTANVYTGGFGAEFGGRMSSVMDIKTRAGNNKRFSGKFDANTFGAKLLLEGPIVKFKEKNKNTSLSYILSGKGSYLEYSSKFFYPYLESTLPYTYLDLYGKLSLNTQNGTFLDFFGFRFDDKMNYSSIASYNWNNWGVGTNFLIVPGVVPTTIEGCIFYTNYATSLREVEETEKLRTSTIDGFTASLKFNYFVGKSVFNVGFDLIGYTTTYSVLAEPEDHTTDLGLFVKYKYNFRDILLIEPSFRLQSYFSVPAYSPEPRLSLKYNITPKIRIKIAGGMYSQNFTSITSDQDVVNFFYGFSSSPSLMQLPQFTEKEHTSSLQKAQHAVLGLELDVIKYTSINIEGYYKHFDPIVSANRYQVSRTELPSETGLPTTDFLWENGHAYGGDITVKFERKGFYVWMVYSLAWVIRNDGMVDYRPHFDRRHNINLLFSYAWGKRNSWQVDLRWNFGSGFPFTKTQSTYPQAVVDNINDDYIHSNEVPSILLSELNTGRLPNYHRLDFSVKKKFYLGERNSIEISLSATNVYNYYNIFYVNRVTGNVIYQLPILYNLGFAWSF